MARRGSASWPGTFSGTRGCALDEGARGISSRVLAVVGVAAEVRMALLRVTADSAVAACAAVAT